MQKIDPSTAENERLKAKREETSHSSVRRNGETSSTMNEKPNSSDSRVIRRHQVDRMLAFSCVSDDFVRQGGVES